jgi:sulfate adenylyltransferase subunit 2
MNAQTKDGAPFLDALEAEAAHVLREIAGERDRPALLFSGGKDSAVLLHVALKAFAPEALPFPLLHVDTGQNFPEVLAFRDARVRETGARLVVGSVEQSIAIGTVEVDGPLAPRNAAQSVTLGEAIAAHGFDALFGGARRDEEKARAKERVVSLRDAYGGWNPKAQRPELWRLYNARIRKGEHVRVFPLSNWTEADIWAYIAREGIALPALYFAHERHVVRRDGFLWAVTDLTPARAGERIERLTVRYRTVGDMTCTCPVESTAATPLEIWRETLTSEVSERGASRADDRATPAAMERRKREGYF